MERKSLREQLREKGLGYVRPFLITLGWGILLGGLTLGAIFQGLLLPQFRGQPPPDILPTENLRIVLFYVGFFLLCVFSGLLLADLGRSIGGYLSAYLIGGGIVFWALSAPGISNATYEMLGLTITREALGTLALDWTFRALFPIPLFLGLFGSIVGSAVEERYSLFQPPATLDQYKAKAAGSSSAPST